MSRFNFNKSNNPIMGDKALQKAVSRAKAETIEGPTMVEEQYEVMTMEGAINKTLMLFGILLITTYFSYQMPNGFLLIGGAIGGLICVLIAVFKPHTSPVVAPIYAALEGLFVGTITAMYAAQTEGIVFQAISLTFATLFTMLFIYKAGIIKVTDKFRSGVIMATGAILLVYVVSFIGSFVGFNVPYLHEGGIIGIGISLVIIGVAALNLLLDFDMFDKSVEYGAPKYMEWFCGMGLMITLVWLYIEFLRLLFKFQND